MVCACYKYLKERVMMRQRGRSYSDFDASIGDAEVTLVAFFFSKSDKSRLIRAKCSAF